MEKVLFIARLFVASLLVAGAGCGPEGPELPASPDSGFNSLSAYSSYSPVKINILPLTQVVSDIDGQQAPKIIAYVSLLDAFGSHQKSPAIFRFELYERIQRSAEPKGSRIFIWPDIDLTNAVENNNYWRDFLMAYEFDLNLEDQINRDHIVLHATALCPNGRRLSAQLELKYKK